MAQHFHRHDLPDGLDLGSVVAIDCETMGLLPHRDRLCLVQLSSGDGDAHLVQISQDQETAPNLTKMLSDANVLKLFHFGRFDIAVLLHRFGVLTAPVYCTKIASKLTRTYTDRHGLKDLLKEVLAVDITKYQQSSDWGAPELSEAQLEYAASDVLYLHALRDAMDQRLAREGRTQHAAAAFAYLPHRAALDLAGDTTETGDSLSAAREVILQEAEALKLLAQSLDSRFEAAIAAMLSASGRIIVCGMGKSGHIARKVAATLASTGTPAHFVHPGEASHGDLGMVMEGDVVLALSFSGETAELADVIAHTRERRISLIGISSNPGSTLLKKADIALVLPEVKEAALEGLAPTTSTTMSLALGDALAAVLVQRRGFTPDDFRVIHPGGSLGARLARVRDLMHQGEAVPMAMESAPMGDVLIEISRKGFGVAAVTDAKGFLRGIITDGDLRRNMGALLEHNAAQVMTPSPKTVGPEMRAGEALAIMNERKITCLIVCGDTGKPEGIIHIHDCLRAGVG